jgi:hypothetical protein
VDPERSRRGRDTVLHRMGRRLPVVRHLARLARAAGHRYLN